MSQATYRDHAADDGKCYPCANPHCTNWVRTGKSDGTSTLECVPCVDGVGNGAQTRRENNGAEARREHQSGT